MHPTTFLGIDIAKDTFDVALRRGERTWAGHFPNDPDGFRQLSAWLKKRQVRRGWACLEATGRYGEDLAQYLYDQGHPVSVVNPRRIQAYAQSQLARNRSDPLDADLIARFCQSQRPELWTPPAPELQELRELTHQYDAVQAQRQQVLNRLSAGVKSPAVRRQLEAQRAFCDEQLEQLQQLMRDHIDTHPDLKRRQALLDSIPGIGELTAAKLLARDLERFDDARALAAYAGLTPRNHTSGTSVRRRPQLSRIGPSRLRRDLYLPAVVATRYNPIIKALYERLRARGHCAMSALGAAMHKLLHLAYGVLKSGRPFDPNYALKTQLVS